MGWEEEENYVKKQHLLDYVKRQELDNYAKKHEIPDHRIYALKEDISRDYIKKSDLPKIPNMNDYIKKSELEAVVIQNINMIMRHLEPHTNHRYCTNELFNKIRHDLNHKLKKLDHRWRNV